MFALRQSVTTRFSNSSPSRSAAVNAFEKCAVLRQRDVFRVRAVSHCESPFFPQRIVFPQQVSTFQFSISSFSLCPPEFLSVLCVLLFGPRFSPSTLRLSGDIFAL